MRKLRIGMVGCGAIGKGVAYFIEKELSDKAKIAAVHDIDLKAARFFNKNLKSHPKICDLDSLMRDVDLVIEAASVKAAKGVLAKAVSFKKDAVIISVGALVGNHLILRKAEQRGVKVYIPAGAICGIDGLGALSLANINKVSLITSKPPRGLAGADYFVKKKINLERIKKETVVFKGSVSQAIKYFPKNINVAATLMLASSFSNLGGRSKVGVVIKAKPGLKRNVHRIEIDAKEARVSIEVENVPSKLNPKTSTLAILSTQYLLKKIFSSFKIGG